MIFTPRNVFGNNFRLTSRPGYLFTRLMANQKQFIKVTVKEGYCRSIINVISMPFHDLCLPSSLVTSVLDSQTEHFAVS